MKKTLIYSLLCLVSVPLNLLSEVSVEKVAFISQQDPKIVDPLIADYHTKIADFGLTCECRQELYNSVKELDGSDIFKPNSECEFSSTTTTDEDLKKIVSELANKDVDNLFETYANALKIDTSISNECYNGFLDAITGLPKSALFNK